jgi:hypothetical protein
MSRGAGVVREVEIREARYVASAAGAQFPGQQPHHGKARPLTEAKWLQQLPPAVLKRRGDRVYGGKWQGAPQAKNDLAARYCELRRGSNQFGVQPEQPKLRAKAATTIGF